jgi:hypothetical protein
MKTQRIIILVVALSMLAACGPAATPTPDPISIVQEYYDAINAKQLDKAVALVADDALFAGPPERLVGKEAIRKSLQGVINGGIRVDISNVQADGGKVTYTYRVTQGDLLIDRGDDGVTIVQGGQITFDGTGPGLTVECLKDDSLVFCAEK